MAGKPGRGAELSALAREAPAPPAPPGLSSAEAAALVRRFGENVIVPEVHRSLCRRLAGAAADPTVFHHAVAPTVF